MKTHVNNSTPLPAEFPSLLHSIPLHCDLNGLGRILTDGWRIESGAKIQSLISPDKINQVSSIAVWHLAQWKRRAEQALGQEWKEKQRVICLVFSFCISELVPLFLNGLEESLIRITQVLGVIHRFNWFQCCHLNIAYHMHLWGGSTIPSLFQDSMCQKSAVRLCLSPAKPASPGKRSIKQERGDAAAC